MKSETRRSDPSDGREMSSEVVVPGFWMLIMEEPPPSRHTADTQPRAIISAARALAFRPRL